MLKPVLYPRYIFCCDERHRGQEPMWLKQLPKNAWVIVRARTTAARALLLAALQSARGRRRDIKLLISVDAYTALRRGADGVHWPEAQLAQRRHDLPPRLLQTAAVHSPKAARRAQRDARITAVLISPILPTPSHTDRKSIGWRRGKEYARVAARPAYAMGGMNRNSLYISCRYGFSGCAGVSLWSARCVL